MNDQLSAGVRNAPVPPVTANVWSVLPPGTWPAVVRAGAKAAGNIFVLGLIVAGVCHLLPVAPSIL